VKKAKHLGEEAKVSVRNARRDTNEFIKKAVKNGYPEDGGKEKESLVQDLTNKYSEKIDHFLDSKEKEIMTV
jgi:ribosome recycling factor